MLKTLCSASHRDTGNFERSELDALMAEDETTSLVASVTQANAEDWRVQMRQVRSGQR